MNYIVSATGVITIVIDNESFSIGLDHPNYMSIKDAINSNDADSIKELADVPKAMVLYTDGDVDIEGDVLRYKGDELHNSLSRRIIGMMREGFPFQPMLNFLDNCMKNPSKHSIDQLYTFLENKHLPITEDGSFLAYKAVDKNFNDKWTGKINNQVGEVVEMPRNRVEDDFNQACGSGLHAGALEYVEGYKCDNGGDQVVIVKINPEDVVSVPVDHKFQKLRCCKYEVVAIYDGKLDGILHKEDNAEEWSREGFLEYMEAMMGTQKEVLAGVA